jgi:hypothetical protein
MSPEPSFPRNGNVKLNHHDPASENTEFAKIPCCRDKEIEIIKELS